MLFAMLIHAKLGCETIIQDYISSNLLKNIFEKIINIIAFMSLFLVILAIVKINIF